MNKVLSIRVRCQDNLIVRGRSCTVQMIPFTGEAYGDFFSGSILGTGVDTQTIREGEPARLSARYMLEGKDYTGTACRIFIENSRHDEEGWHPVLVTDSAALASWEEKSLLASVDPCEGGVLVQIYCRTENE